jgi:hypothetical protein
MLASTSPVFLFLISIMGHQPLPIRAALGRSSSAVGRLFMMLGEYTR